MGLTWAKGTRATWAEAERLCPGIEAEWRSMLGTKHFDEVLLEGRTVRIPSPRPPSGHEWRIEVHMGVRDPFDYHGRNPKDQSWMVELIQLDPEGKWHSPPMWRRWPGGDWTSPYPVPKTMLLRFEPIVYRPRRSSHYIDITAEIGPSGSVGPNLRSFKDIDVSAEIPAPPPVDHESYATPIGFIDPEEK